MAEPEKRLQGKVALVTGGSRGIGAAIAKRLGEEGAHVAISYSASPDAAQTVIAAIRDHGRKAEAIKADSADPSEVAGLVKSVVQRFGRLHILEQPASYRKQTSCSNTLEPINFSALNRFQLTAG